MGAGLIDDFIRNILSVPFYPCHFVHTILSNAILSVYHLVHTILSVGPYHFVRYHFVLKPEKANNLDLTATFFMKNASNRNRNLKTSKALLKSQAHQSTSLFTSTATNQSFFSKGWSREAQVRFSVGQKGTE